MERVNTEGVRRVVIRIRILMKWSSEYIYDVGGKILPRPDGGKILPQLPAKQPPPVTPR